jgi:hypothetical protein
MYSLLSICFLKQPNCKRAELKKTIKVPSSTARTDGQTVRGSVTKQSIRASCTAGNSDRLIISILQGCLSTTDTHSTAESPYCLYIQLFGLPVCSLIDEAVSVTLQGPELQMIKQLLNNNKKVNLSLCLQNWALCHEGVCGSGCIDPHFLEFDTSWGWVVRFTPWPLYPRVKVPRYPLDRRLGGPLPVLEIRTLGRPACSHSIIAE